ncbi:hypothetical protein C1H46_027981 [Malus baccata]|uniref:Uncharacterized protein n=1 Tax=Malus baccata TaxID=106549 RepID=A0A540LJM1_MALBA|nr:hypothetical protein C1H46_027981 [Malus baccata]
MHTIMSSVLKIGLGARRGGAEAIRSESLRKIGELLGARLGALRRVGRSRRLSRRRSGRSEMIF